MRLYSTRSNTAPVSSLEAILKGIAPDGGLYTPNDFDPLKIDTYALLGKSFFEISETVVGKLLDDFSAEEMHALVHAAYEKRFTSDEITPLTKVGNDYVLELYHGPTSAFKDVALCLLPRLLTSAKEKLGVREDIAILTATSGDTGKAALEGFHDVEGTKILVFYPHGGVSDVQHAQMATQVGANVGVCAVEGNFDDAQTGVKRLFADDDRNHWAQSAGIRLSSANSINIGRLAPQVAYYFKAYTDLVGCGEISYGEAVDFVVPTGNFGDILAGEFARRMGLPIHKLICASNANNVLTDFIQTGVYDKRRDFRKTISPSMDILVSSNLERYLYLASGCDTDLVASLMRSLSETGLYSVPASLLSELQSHFDADCATDSEALESIRKVWNTYGYLIDPHTAVAWAVREKTAGTHKTVILSTASPYKFSRDVLSALSETVPQDGFECMEALNRLTGAPIPKNLSGLKDKAIRFNRVIHKEDMLSYAKEALSR